MNRQRDVKPVDFRELAEAYEPLKSKLIPTPGGATIDFKDALSQRLLTQAILHHDFNLTVEVPEDRLCPPIPNRLNYIHWLQDLHHSLTFWKVEDKVDASVKVIDIGTGASAIYPLLGVMSNPSWSFIATEIDKLSIESSRRNVSLNSLEDRIRIYPVKKDEGILVPLLSDTDLHVDFTMCNPPFYSSEEEISRLAELKDSEPSAICTGSSNEMITPGGEERFVKQMIEESLQVSERCRWFTAMLGKQSSLSSLIKFLKEHKVRYRSDCRCSWIVITAFQIDNYALAQFVQGNTRRWALGWSFRTEKLGDDCARFRSSTLQELMPSPNCRTHTLNESTSSDVGIERLLEVLLNLDFVKTRRLENGAIVVEAERNSWSRAERRKRARNADYDSNSGETGMKVEAGLKACFWFDQGAAAKPQLRGRWLDGKDRALWDSFWSHAVRKFSL